MSSPVSTNRVSSTIPPFALGEERVGAIVVGGDHTGLGIVRSLGRRKIPVFVIESQHSISVYSRYATRVVRVKDLRDPLSTVEAILDIGTRFGLKGWVLFPTRDETVMAFSLYRDRLASFFRVTSPPWETTQFVWDKGKTYELAKELGIPAPQTWKVSSASDLPGLYKHLPLAIKPAIKEHFFYATGEKAWRVETPEQLQESFEAALKIISIDEILLQEIIPGNGECQLSHCPFLREGKTHSSLTAKRLRQYPREFGRAATYVETVDEPEVAELSERFLRAIDFSGIAELEFKHDPRDNRYKLLDVNARVWGFHALGLAAGVDFPYLLFCDQLGYAPVPGISKVGVGWVRLLTDAPTAFSDLLKGHLSLTSYLRSLRRIRTESVFSWTDPLPFIAEFLLLPYFIRKKMPSQDRQTRSISRALEGPK